MNFQADSRPPAASMAQGPGYRSSFTRYRFALSAWAGLLVSMRPQPTAAQGCAHSKVRVRVVEGSSEILSTHFIFHFPFQNPPWSEALLLQTCAGFLAVWFSLDRRESLHMCVAVVRAVIVVARRAVGRGTTGETLGADPCICSALASFPCHCD